jgi:hypothetical protein
MDRMIGLALKSASRPREYAEPATLYSFRRWMRAGKAMPRRNGNSGEVKMSLGMFSPPLDMPTM